MRGLVAALSAVALLVAGCGGNGDSGKKEAMGPIDWDLTKSHTVDDVDWPKPDLDAVDVDPSAGARIALPGGKAFDVDEGVGRHLFMKREGDTVSQLQVNTVPLTRDDAYELAKRWAHDWDLPAKPIEEWYRASADGKPSDVQNALSVGPPGKTTGPGGPEPDVKILYSFDEQKPWIVAFELGWTRQTGT